MSVISILLVDDEPNILRTLARDLRGHGFSVRTAPSAAEGLDVLGREEIDVVISDQTMPEMSGLEFLSEVKLRYCDVVRVVLTGHADLPMVMRAFNEGTAQQLLTKPWDSVELRETLAKIVAHAGRVKESRSSVPASPGLLDNLESSHPGITHVQRAEDGAIELDEDAMDPNELLAVLGGSSVS